MRIRSLLVVAAAILVTACQSVQTTQPGAIGVTRKQLMAVSSEKVDEGAKVAYDQELNKARQAGSLNTDKQAYDRVQKISQRLIPQTAIFRPDAPSWHWEVNVETSKDVNAYCMPGGKIMVYTGLIDTIKPTDAELAAVIGHEIAHALREHSRERLSRAYAEQAVLAGVAVATGGEATTMQIASQVSAVTFTLPHSREQEAEADRIGLELMARAGYDPNAAVTLWQKMSKAGGGGGPEFLSTHPSGESRIRDLEKNVPLVLPLYQAGAK
ncbi:M48 family metallopeptidase [Steroidobacter cummioxidans]|uniref:M48 family metallopeptidase n=1 Tax=Steroidobacter cummioxidans TaxID=1803913 RepID=UPI000E317B43|nr:M48 family metallopeptidase [Steroidobacter cummioxidans]